MTVRAPVHRLASLVDCALVPNRLKYLDIGGIIVVGVREVGVVPLAKDAEALEALALDVDIFNSHLAAYLTDCGLWKLVEFLRPETLFNLVLNRLAMTIPARDVLYVIALHHVIAIDEVLGDLIHGMAQVYGAVCIGRAIVQDKFRMTGILFTLQIINVVVFPCLQTLGLVF